MAELAGTTFFDLKTAFEAHTGMSGEIDDAELAIWFNEAQLDLAVDCGIKELPALFDAGNSSAVSELPPVLHDLLPIFAASRYWDRESEGDTEESMHGTKWMSYYQQQKALRKAMLNLGGEKPQQWAVI